ncbi:helix-turn-helix transcriptional regulator [Flavitalea flava]
MEENEKKQGRASGLQEQTRTLRDDSGYRMQIDEISFDQIDLKWGSYINPREKLIALHPGKETIVSHFRMVDSPAAYPTGYRAGSLSANQKKWLTIAEKQFVVYRESSGPYDFSVAPTGEKPRSFFELALTDSFFTQLFTEESEFLVRFRDQSVCRSPSPDFTGQMVPAMNGIIREMRNNPYDGHLKGVYLEAKAIELFLLQVRQLDQDKKTKRSTLKQGDIDRLQAVREYMDLHYDESFSITGLARMAGINQLKLKNGFKDLFHHTVFGYLGEVRMQEAKRLLLDEKMDIHEVAERMGYKYPHHFTAAFKKKFGVVPRDLKS